MKTLFLLFLTFSLMSCGSITTRQYKDKSIDTSLKTIRVPMLNQQNKVEVGENMYEKIYVEPSNEYFVILDKEAIVQNNADVQYGWLLLGIVGAGIMAATADYNPTTEFNNAKHSLLISDEGYKMICHKLNCLIDMENKGIFTHISKQKSKNFKAIKDPITYSTKRKPPIFREGSFKYTALYQGRVGNKIKLSFREFYNDMARPSFTQDVDYELNDDGQTLIGFKGLRIKVLDATNFYISYVVTTDYK